MREGEREQCTLSQRHTLLKLIQNPQFRVYDRKSEFKQEKDTQTHTHTLNTCVLSVCEAKAMFRRMEGCHALFFCLLILNVTN